MDCLLGDIILSANVFHDMLKRALSTLNDGDGVVCDWMMPYFIRIMMLYMGFTNYYYYYYYYYLFCVCSFLNELHIKLRSFKSSEHIIDTGHTAISASL